MKKKILGFTTLLFCAFMMCLIYINSDADKTKQKNQNNEITSPSPQVITAKEKISNQSLIKKDATPIKKEKIAVVKTDEFELAREKYRELHNNHPFRKRMHLAKSDRKAIGLPPNAYYEQEFLYNMDPAVGRPMYEDLRAVQEQLQLDRELGRVPGDGLDNQWIERGPNNVGGRTRYLGFAPGSTTKVFAGGVSGGIWINTDITNAANSWQQVTGIPNNMAVTCMTVDPQNPLIMYIGTGEVYTWGAVNGNGVYKSTDGGINWKHIYGGSTGNINNDITYIQDIVAWRNPSTGLTEVFFGADSMMYTEEVTSGSGGAGWSVPGLNTIGLYRSTDGENFNRLTNAALYSTAGTKFFAPNNFDIDMDGNLFMGTKYSYVTGQGGGRIFKCTNGTDWTNVRDFGTNGRVQIAASKTTSGKMYVLLEDRVVTSAPVKIKKTTDGFVANNDAVTIPTSTGRQPPGAADFTRGQNFYNLMIEVDPMNDANFYVAGIEIFKSTNSGTSWTQLTDWTGDNGALDGVHSDHHCMAFAPGQSSRAIFGCDGGVYYTNDSGTTIKSRNTGYNVTQFYKGSINQTGTTKLLAGAQDNGSQFIDNAPMAIAASSEINGGDGCWNFIDRDEQFMITSYVYNVYQRHNMDGTDSYAIASDQDNGDFVNQCGLDSANNKLYANGTVPAVASPPTPAVYQVFRYNLGAGSATKTTLTNALLNDIPTYFTANPFTTTTLLVGTASGRVLKLTNASTTPVWSNISNGTWNGAVSDIRYGVTEQDIFVTFHNYGVASVWYSSNGGTSWQNKEGDLPNIPVKCILQNPFNVNEVILGTELGVWTTSNFSNAAPTWIQSYNGMSDVKVLSFDYRTSNNTILASTYGRGMFTGEFWQCGSITSTYSTSGWSNGVPNKRVAAVISSDFSSTATLEACSLSITGTAQVTINTGHSLKIGEAVTVASGASLTIENGAALVQFKDAAINTGNIIVKRNSAPMIRQDYTAWSSPVASQQLLAFSPNTLSNRFYQYLYTGNTTATAYQSVDPTTNFTVGKGYMIRVDNTWSPSVASPFNGIFAGVPNNGKMTTPIGLGYNLIGNPYSSPISATAFLTRNPKVGALYFWTHTAPASGGTYPTNNYATYTLVGGVASAAGGAVPNGIIQTGQGFFINTTVTTNAIFENIQRRDAVASTQFYKSTDNSQEQTNSESSRLWLNLNEGTTDVNQILVGYMQAASVNVDDNIDGLMLDTSRSMLYSLIDSDKAYVIQGKGLPFDDNDEVLLGFKAINSGNFSINLGSFDGLFADQGIYLKDTYTNQLVNLKVADYQFTSVEGTFNNRFSIVYKQPFLSNNDIVLENTVGVYAQNNVIKINSLQENIANVTVYDLLGKLLYDNSTIDTKELVISNLNAKNQALIVRLTLSNGQKINKKIIL